MINIIKQEIPIDESLKKKLEFICDFCNTTPTFINGSIRKIDKSNLVYVEPHKVIINNIMFLVFNYSNDVYIKNFGNKIKISELEDFLKQFGYDEYNLKYKLNNKCRFDLKKIELIDIEIEDLSKKIKLITDEKPNKDIEVSLVNLKHNYNKLFIKLVEFDESINSNDISTDKILENYKITFKELNLKNLVSLSIINHKLMDYIFHRK